MQTIEQFGQTIKAKYPQYNDMSDGELGQKMLTKYPQYQDMVSTTSPSKSGILSKVGGYLKDRITQFGSNSGLDGKGSEIIRGPEGKLAYKDPVAAKENFDKITNFSISSGPAGLKDVTVAPLKAGLLKLSAEKQYNQALGATTKPLKQLSDKVVPRLLKDKVIAMTRPGLEAKTHEALGKAGDALESVVESIPPDSPTKSKPILQALKSFKEAFYVSENGKRIVVDEVGYKNAEKMENLIKEFGDDVSFGTIRKVRQILDTAVTKGGKAFGRTVSEGSMVDAQRESANAIRNELAKQYPELAVVNAEYTFWKNVHQVISATVERTKSQATPLGETIAGVGGAVAGFGSGAGHAIASAVAFKWIKKILTSTGYRTLSAVAKNELADMIAKGKFDGAWELVQRGSTFINPPSQVR